MPRLRVVGFTLLFLFIIGIGLPIATAAFNGIDEIELNLSADKTTVDVGEDITFYADGSTGPIQKFFWEFHDGTPPIETDASEPEGWTIQHAFPIEGIFLVSLCANDPHWSSARVTLEIHVINTRPTAQIIGPTEVAEDETATFSSEESEDTPNDIETLNYFWTLGDGTTAEEGIVEHSYSEAGEYPITLYVIDDQGALDVETVFLTVVNHPPLAAFTTDAIVQDDMIYALEDEAIIFDASSSCDTLTDAEELRYYWDFGDNTVSNDPVLSHTYSESGIFEVTLLVMDDDGEQSQVSGTVEITNQAPSVDILDDEVILHEGETYVFVADSWDSPSDYPLLNYHWTFGDSGWRASNYWMDDWTGDVELIVEDDDGETAFDEIQVNVLNEPPNVWIEKATVKCNISLLIVGNKWQTIDLTMGHDDQIVWGDSLLFELSEPPGFGPPTEIPPIVEYDVMNFQFDISYLWEICLDYDSEVKAGNTQVWVILAFENGYNIFIHHTFKNQKPDTWQWGFTPNYVFAYAPIEILLAMFDPGSDQLLLEVTRQFDSHSTTMVLESFDATYPSFHTQTIILTPVDYWPNSLHNAESLSKILNKLEKQGYTLSLSLEVFDDDGESANTDVTFQFSYEHGLLLLGAGPTTQLTALPSTTIEDELLEFQAISTYPSNYEDTPNYLWYFGDGTSSSGATTTHTYTNEGTYLIRLHVTDATSTKVYYHLLTVHNPDPIPQSTQTFYEVFEEDIIQFDASDTSDTTSDIEYLRFFWDFGDGSTASTPETSHTYAQEGIYAVTLLVIDDNGATAIETREVIVRNQPPRILGPTAFSAAEGETMMIEVAIEDSILDEPNLSYSWIINGDELTSRRFALWRDNGAYTAHLQVEDSDGQTASAQIQIAVDNIKPEVFLPPVNSYGISQPITFTAFAIDAFTDFDDLTFDWYIDGEYPSGISHSPWSTLINLFEHTGNYLITVEVEDDANQKDSAEFICTIVLDENGNGIPDELELELDTDKDGLPDYLELEYGTDPENVDTDGDGLWDGINTDVGEGELTAGTNPLDPDTDNDQLLDGVEVFGWYITIITAEGKLEKFVNSNPLSPDTDEDAIADKFEYNFGFNPQRIDTDGDGLDDYTENVTLSTDPTNYDTDGDKLEDGEELQHYNYAVTINGVTQQKTSYSDPLKPDTDGDNLTDYEERYSGADGFITDSQMNDTDSDLALDSGEGFSQDFDLGKRVPVTTTSDFELQLNTVGQTNRFTITIGFTEIEASSFYFEIYKSAQEPIIHQEVETTSPIFYRVYDLTSGFINVAGTWRLHIDISSKAILDEFSASVSIVVDPTVDDMDSDGLLDGQELSGEWLTNPLLADTDQDGWDDPYEIMRGTNPLSPDSDGDNIADPHDVNPTHNAMVKVRVSKARYGGVYYAFTSPPHLLATLAISNGGSYITAPRACNEGSIGWPWPHIIANFHYDYYFDTPDDMSTISLHGSLWIEGYGFADTKLFEFSTSYALGSTLQRTFYGPTIWGGPFPWLHLDRHWMQITISTTYRPRTNTIAIYTNDTFANGHYRSLERYYVITLDVTDYPSADSPFEHGINTIVIPRTIFQYTELHQLIEDEQIPNCLYGAKFLGIDDEAAQISQFVEGIITTSCTSQYAQEILNLVLKNVTGYVVYSFNSIGVAEDYGLPQDVLRLIPLQGISNSPTGTQPVGFWEWLAGLIVGIVNLIADGVKLICGALIALVGFLVQLVFAVIEWGLNLIGAFTAQAIKAVVEVVRLAVIALGFVFGALIRAFYFMAALFYLPFLFLMGLEPSLQIEWNLLKISFVGSWIAFHFADEVSEDFPWYRLDIKMERGASPGRTLFHFGIAQEESGTTGEADEEYLENNFRVVAQMQVEQVAAIIGYVAPMIIFHFVFNDIKAATIAFFVLLGVQIGLGIAYRIIWGLEGWITAANAAMAAAITNIKSFLLKLFYGVAKVLWNIKFIIAVQKESGVGTAAIARFMKDVIKNAYKMALGLACFLLAFLFTEFYLIQL